MIATPRPVINADNAWRRWAIISANGSKQRIIANQKPETICEACCRATTQCQKEMVNQGVQACCPGGHGSDYVITEALGENLSAALVGTTYEASDSEMKFDPQTHARQIGNHPSRATINTMGGRTAFGVTAASGLATCGDIDHVGSVMHCLHVQFGGNQIGKSKMGSHGAISPSETRPVEPQTSSRLSQSQFSEPIGNMNDRKVVETGTDARQGQPGRPMLIVLVAGLALALVAWLGAEMWGEATDAPAEQTATPPAQSNAPEAPEQASTTPAVPAPTDGTTRPDGGTGGESQTSQPAGSTTRP